MNAIRIRKRLDAAIAELPELTPFVGRTVEIVVLDEPGPQPLETRETFFALAPPDPTPEEHAANMAELREMAKTDPKLAAFLKAIDEDALDIDAIIRARGMS